MCLGPDFKNNTARLYINYTFNKFSSPEAQLVLYVELVNVSSVNF